MYNYMIIRVYTLVYVYNIYYTSIVFPCALYLDARIPSGNLSTCAERQVLRFGSKGRIERVLLGNAIQLV